MNADTLIDRLDALKVRLIQESCALLRSAPYADDPRARDEDQAVASRLAKQAAVLADAVAVCRVHRARLEGAA